MSAVTHTPEETASILTQALPYIQQFAGTTVVVKFGGNAMIDPHLFTTFAADIVLMHSVVIKPIVVHGGGPQIGALLAKIGTGLVEANPKAIEDGFAHRVAAAWVAAVIKGGIRVISVYLIGSVGINEANQKILDAVVLLVKSLKGP